MIGMFLNGGALPPGTVPLYGSDPMTEPRVQFVLVVVVIIMIPTMLFVKPYCIHKAQQEKKEAMRSPSMTSVQLQKAKLSDDEDNLPSPDREEEEGLLIPSINATIVDRDGSGAYQRKRESSLMKEEYDNEG